MTIGTNRHGSNGDYTVYIKRPITVQAAQASTSRSSNGTNQGMATTDPWAVGTGAWWNEPNTPFAKEKNNNLLSVKKWEECRMAHDLEPECSAKNSYG
jgi:hypothetical protein